MPDMSSLLVPAAPGAGPAHDEHAAAFSGGAIGSALARLTAAASASAHVDLMSSELQLRGCSTILDTLGLALIDVVAAEAAPVAGGPPGLRP